jgi:hypothetical protein
MFTTIRKAVSLGCLATLAACGGSSGGGQDMGQLTLRIGDAPVDGATEVVVVFTGVVLHGPGGTHRIEFTEPRDIDLLAYQNGATVDLLDDVEVEAGEYDWMRLEVIAEQNRSDGSYILFQTGEQYPLYVPSGAQTGLKLNRPFTVAAGGITRLVADFDLRKSIIQPPGLSPNYELKPVLRLMDELEVGSGGMPVPRTVQAASISSRALTRRRMMRTAMPRTVPIRSSTSRSRSTASRRSCPTRSPSRKPATTPWRRPATSTSMRHRKRANTTRAPRAASRDSKRWPGPRMARWSSSLTRLRK